ncbi:bile acid:sodium symporter family protein [Pseudonocardia endophytica]|uniref:BASS family bile acid:Na+ symporter n=1 Tax=Pseudonocardia endophytica TaxID=401976 RepID=A0A4R1HX21_PSEEN|nr:bile acid:sodium symporter family protein [Pseudonocardia endophytica]TCK27304.1 BASS family bile acid:Na+ symporter [Pseudonocardia endophytica]
MSEVLVTVGLPIALAIVMLGLGLSLTVADFARVARRPRAVAAALVTQLALLPLVCFGLVILAGLDPLLAVGMMLLAASPGGTTANLFSHLFRGDVALNITLTAVNSILAVVTLPLVVNLSLAWFRPVVDGGTLGLDLAKSAQVFAVVLVPVAIGMLIRRVRPSFADRADRPVRILSAVVLAAVIVGAILAEEDFVDYVVEVGVVTVVFCLISLAAGYLLPRLLRVGHAQSVASAFEVGIHNSTIAITIALSVLGDERLAVPAAVYGVLMFPLAVGAGVLLRRLAPAPLSAGDTVPS